MKRFRGAVFTMLVTYQILAGGLSAKTLSVILLSNASTQNVIQGLLKEYHQQHPEIDFQVSVLPSVGFLAKLNTLATAGEFPDIVEVTTAMIQNYADTALDLTKNTDRNEYRCSYFTG